MKKYDIKKIVKMTSMVCGFIALNSAIYSEVQASNGGGGVECEVWYDGRPFAYCFTVPNETCSVPIGDHTFVCNNSYGPMYAP